MDEMPKDRFVQIGDLHFWEVVWNPLKLLNKRILGNANVFLKRRHEYPVAFANTYTDTVAALGARTVVLTGDFTSTSTDAEFEAGAAFARGLAARGLEVIAMPGNHDVYTFHTLRTGKFRKHFGEFMPEAGYPARFDLPGGTPLIVVPTVRPNILSSKGQVTAEEVKQTKALLDACPDSPVVIAGHYPMLHETYAYRSKPSRRLRNAAALRAMLGETNRDILYIAGHVHRFSYVRDPVHARLRHVTAPAFFQLRKKENVRGAFCEICITEKGFQVYHHEHTDSWMRIEAQAAEAPGKAPPGSE
jgi:predicted phosphodiesterase